MNLKSRLFLFYSSCDSYLCSETRSLWNCLNSHKQLNLENCKSHKKMNIVITQKYYFGLIRNRQRSPPCIPNQISKPQVRGTLSNSNDYSKRLEKQSSLKTIKSWLCLSRIFTHPPTNQLYTVQCILRRCQQNKYETFCSKQGFNQTTHVCIKKMS